MRVTKTGSRGVREIKERLKSIKEEENKPQERLTKRIIHPAPIENLEEWNALMIVVGMFVRWMADASKLKEDSKEFRFGMLALNEKMGLVTESMTLEYEIVHRLGRRMDEIMERLTNIEKQWT